MVAMVLHFIMSIIYTFIIGWLSKRVSSGAAILIGAGLGLVLYFINFYGFTTVFPWFAMARTWVTIFTHIMFGAVAGYAFHKIYHPAKEVYA